MIVANCFFVLFDLYLAYPIQGLFYKCRHIGFIVVEECATFAVSYNKAQSQCSVAKQLR